jgi:hypothetical protein
MAALTSIVGANCTLLLGTADTSKPSSHPVSLTIHLVALDEKRAAPKHAPRRATATATTPQPAMPMHQAPTRTAPPRLSLDEAARAQKLSDALSAAPHRRHEPAPM